MHAKASLSSYEKVSFSITLSASVEDWRAALKQLQGLKGSCGYISWPLSGFDDAIRKVLGDLDKTHVALLTQEDRAALASAKG